MARIAATSGWGGRGRFPLVAAICCAGAVLTLAGCQKQEDQKLVAAGMKDPSSVQFRNWRSSKAGACGEVNAKNSYGAYAGFQPFVLLRASKTVMFEPEAAPNQEAVERAKRGCEAIRIVKKVENASEFFDTYPDRDDEISEKCSLAADLARQHTERSLYNAAIKAACP